MSQLLSRIAKLSLLSSSSSVVKKGFYFSKLRFFSTTTPPTPTPYLLFSEISGVKSPIELMQEIYLDDPRKEERVKIPVPTLPKELKRSTLIGSSRGWVGMQNRDDSTISLTNIFNPSASVSSHKVISLPPLSGYDTGPISISLSASPNQQDCVVAALSSHSSFLSLCRPGDSDWRRIKVPFLALGVMYSVRDKKFYLHTNYEEKYEGPIDLESFDFPQVSLHQRFPMSDIPKRRQDQLIATFAEWSYLVESPSGESFIVYWFNDLPVTTSRDEIVMSSPRGFAVYKQDPEKRICTYTEDIGDLCIFLSKSEAFCVSATEYPGLKPNSVYFACFFSGFGYDEISSDVIHVLKSGPCLMTPIFKNVLLNCFGYSSYQWLAPLQ